MLSWRRRCAAARVLDANQFGVCGGVDTAFMSTSRERDVVINYAKGAKAGTLIELQMGMVDRGADVEWLSQYQGEKEVLFAPLTGIEVIGSRVVESLLVVEVRLNINLRSLTIEQVLGKMKASYVSLLSLIDEGLQRTMRPHRRSASVCKPSARNQWHAGRTLQ